jgi:recombinational DNA repair protein (RecF pathway)
MAGGQSITHKLIYYYFLWNLLSFLGHRPKIQKCLVCQKKINESKIFWSSLEGGVICLRCSKEIQEKRVINLNTAKLLKLIFQRNWQILRRLKISPRDLEDLETLSQDYLIALGFQ